MVPQPVRVQAHSSVRQAQSDSWPMADTPADAGKRMVLFEELQSFPVFARIDQGNEPLNADMGRAHGLAGRRAPFADGKSARYSLRVMMS